MQGRLRSDNDGANCKHSEHMNGKITEILAGVGKQTAPLAMKIRSSPVISFKLACDLKAAHLKRFKALYPEVNREKERQFVSAKLAAAPCRPGAKPVQRASKCGIS